MCGVSSTGRGQEAIVAVYEYTCAQHGRFDARFAIGTAPDENQCPTCHATARRAFSPPMLGLVPPSATTLFGREERSSDSPEVVTEVPPKVGSIATPPHPALARLPRP
jgi:putative FmdB family regulatory protein